MSSPILNVKSIDVSYGPIKALHGVSLDIHPGEIVTLIGSNGAGRKRTPLAGPFRRSTD